jgi:hypothetical protein
MAHESKRYDDREDKEWSIITNAKY